MRAPTNAWLRVASTVLLLSAVPVTNAGCGGDQGTAGTLVEYDELVAWMEAEEDIVLIDVRTPEEWAAGHIQDAINVHVETLVDRQGNLIDDGTALTSVVPEISQKIVAYCNGYGQDKDFVEIAEELGYTNLFRYEWGTNEWSTRNYLVIEYPSFLNWHEARYPFDEGSDFLVDVLPEPWYTGDDPDHPGGHIAGAINIPIELWGDPRGPIDEGTAFTDVVTETGAKVVFYCGNYTCPKSLVASETAIALGYETVFRYQAGWEEWRDEGNELVPGLEP